MDKFVSWPILESSEVKMMLEFAPPTTFLDLLAQLKHRMRLSNKASPAEGTPVAEPAIFMTAESSEGFYRINQPYNMFAKLCPTLTICFESICGDIVHVHTAGKLLFQRRTEICAIWNKACAILKENKSEHSLHIFLYAFTYDYICMYVTIQADPTLLLPVSPVNTQQGFLIGSGTFWTSN